MDDQKLKILMRDVEPRLRASRLLDADKIPQMLKLAATTVAVRMRSGHGPEGGWGVTERDAIAFVAEMEQRPGFRAFDPSEFREASPMERLRRANKQGNG